MLWNVINRRPLTLFPVPFKYITRPNARFLGTWRVRGGGSAGGGVQTLRARVYLKPCGNTASGPCPCPRPLWGGRPGAPGRGTRWVCSRAPGLSNPGRSYTPPSRQPATVHGGCTPPTCLLLQWMWQFLVVYLPFVFRQSYFCFIRKCLDEWRLVAVGVGSFSACSADIKVKTCFWYYIKRCPLLSRLYTVNLTNVRPSLHSFSFILPPPTFIHLSLSHLCHSRSHKQHTTKSTIFHDQMKTSDCLY